MATDDRPIEEPRWEYHVIFQRGGSAADYCMVLDERGEWGWELVAATEAGDYSSFYFKRRLPARTGHSWPLTTGS